MKRILSLLFAVIISFSFSTSVFADSGVQVSVLRKIDSVVYKFDKDGKNTGVYTGKAKYNDETVYIRKGKILEPTTTIDYDWFTEEITDPELLETIGGGFISFDVFMDELYRYYPTEAGYIEFSPDMTDKTHYKAYLPYSLAPLLYDADGFFGYGYAGDGLIYTTEKAEILYDVMYFCPIKDGKLEFFKLSDLANVSKSYVNEQPFDKAAAKEAAIDDYFYHDGMTITELDEYQAAAYEYVNDTISAEDFDYDERVYGPLPYDHHYYRVTIVD
jgi:hypothetical protein